MRYFSTAPTMGGSVAVGDCDCIPEGHRHQTSALSPCLHRTLVFVSVTFLMRCSQSTATVGKSSYNRVRLVPAELPCLALICYQIVDYSFMPPVQVYHMHVYVPASLCCLIGLDKELEVPWSRQELSKSSWSRDSQVTHVTWPMSCDSCSICMACKSNLVCRCLNFTIFSIGKPHEIKR